MLKDFFSHAVQEVIYRELKLTLVVDMQFFHLREDETKTWRNYLVIQTKPEDFAALKTRFETQPPKLGCWAMIRNGNPYLVFDYGGTISLSETFGSGETLGDKLEVGDVVTVILTDKPQDQLFTITNNALALNFDLSEVIAYSFAYTKELEHIYEFYRHYSKLKDSDGKVQIKKTKRLTFK